MYLPTALSFALAIFTIAKTIKGLNLVDANPPVERLSKKIEQTFISIKDKLNEQYQINEKLDMDNKALSKKLEEYEAKLVSVEEDISAKFEKQTNILTEIVRKDVELKADIRRNKNDGEGIQK